MKIRIRFAVVATLALSLVAPAQTLTPFGANQKVALKAVKPLALKPIEVNPLSAELTPVWMVENPQAGHEKDAFAITQDAGEGVLQIATEYLDPARSTVRVLLPGDGPANGAVWAKSQASYVTFLTKSNKPAQMSFHLLQRGKTAGTFQSGFVATPGEWQRITLPASEFKLKSFSSISGFGVRVANAEKGTQVQIKGIDIGATPFNEATLTSQVTKISIDGDWRFATDASDAGMKGKWFDDKFDDASWKVLKSGASWQQQGVNHSGWGWYRQQLFVPKELEGTPLTLNLCPIPSDDDTWFNGVRVGGISSEYKYKNWITRAYTIPPELIRYGENNTIALRIWGGNITFIGNNSGLVKGPLSAEFDPYAVRFREPGGQAVPAPLFDLSDAQRGKPFEIVFTFPADMAPEPGAQLSYRLSDYTGQEIVAGAAPLSAGKSGVLQAVAAIDRETSQSIYLRGRFRAALTLQGADGKPLYTGARDVDYLSFAKRDNTPLPALASTVEETPYGKLTLIDEIDASTSTFDEPHPYLQSGFSHDISHHTPGGPADVKVNDILGKKARESGFAWFAYRIGRGKLKPHATYLLRIEYPEDKPRFAPIEIQTGQNFMDVGWKNGVGKDDVYEPWPLSGKWAWYDVIVPLDDQTVGTGGTGSAPAENGFWVYFMNKQKPGSYYAMWDAGPAVARMKLYEIDPDKHAPVIHKPANLPHRVLSFDWERQADGDPEDFAKYAKLMGYNAMSPIILKWFFANYADPINGYESVTIDERDYWSHNPYDPASGKPAESLWPDRKSQHARFMEVTKKYGIDYIPRIEWGGSQDLPKEAWAIDLNGAPTKPNRFAPWCGNLLHPATWEDLKKYLDHTIKPYVNDNPQLTGVLWRIRCFRMPISYGKSDLELFSKETGVALPPGSLAQWAAWANGEGKTQYDDWWHKKRMEFHARTVELLKSYRSDLALYYFNWDPDKMGIIEPDITAWAFVQNVVKPAPDGGRAAYEKERAVRKTFTAADYISVLKTGNFGRAFNGLNRADLGIRPDLYKDVKGMQIFSPANYYCYANLPEFLEYFRTPDGTAVSNVVSYDEIGARSINPKFEGNMMTPAGAPFSMALELLAYFHADARTLNYTVYTYGRGFADAHRRFAQAYLALPAIPGTVIDQANADLKVRTYASPNGTYVGVAYKGFDGAALKIKVPGVKPGATIKNLVTDQAIAATVNGDVLEFDLTTGPMELHAFLIQ